MNLTRNPYFLKEAGIAIVEKNYGATYMGAWAVKTKDGGWSEQPVEVFYQPNPDISKGHTNYFGLFTEGGHLLITNAESAFSEPIIGVVTKDGEVLVSRYRHDMQTQGDDMIDGGRDYLRCNANAKTVTITVDGSQFIITENKDEKL